MGGQDSLYSLRTFLTSHDKHWFYSQERKGESTSSGPHAARGPPSPAHPACAPLPRPSSSRPSLTRPPAPWALDPRSSRLPPGPKVAASLPASSAPSPASGGLGSRVFPCPPAPAAPLAASGTSLALLVAVPPPRPLLRWAGPPTLAPRPPDAVLCSPCSRPGPSLLGLWAPLHPADAHVSSYSPDSPPKGTGCVATAPLVQRFPGDRHRPLSPCFREWRLPQTPEPESHPWTAEPCPPTCSPPLALRPPPRARPGRDSCFSLPRSTLHDRSQSDPSPTSRNVISVTLVILRDKTQSNPALGVLPVDPSLQPLEASQDTLFPAFSCGALNLAITMQHK